jgi:hypothetical protein
MILLLTLLAAGCAGSEPAPRVAEGVQRVLAHVRGIT